MLPIDLDREQVVCCFFTIDFYTLQPLTRTGIGAVTLIVEETKANLQ